MKEKYILILALILKIAACWPEDSCIPADKNIGKPLPTLPNQFQTIIESNIINLLNENYTEEVHEYYDYNNNRALVIKYYDYTTEKQYFLYDTFELITVKDLECKVSNLNESDFEDPFGFFKNHTGAHINSPTYYLNYGFNLTTEYLGTGYVRGIDVERWSSCVYVDQIKSYIKLTWSFADNSTWETKVAPSIHQYPVEIVYEGFKNTTEKYEIFRHEFVSFRPYIEPGLYPEIFETPIGAFCPGRKQTKPIPQVSSQFSYRYEATVSFEHLFTVQNEFFDADNKIARIDYQPFTLDAIIDLGTNTITEIHDFNGGVRYIVDKNNEKCLNITVLDGSMSDAMIVETQNGTKYVRIRNALEMFNIDKGQYEYHGSRKVRNIDCDIWIARKENFPQPGYTSTFEWYFSQDYWTSFNSGKLLNQVPIKLIVTTYTPNAAVFGTVVYSYFDYSDQKPDIFTFNLESCFIGINSKHLILSFDEVDQSSVSNQHDLKYQIVSRISNLTNILPTRISNVELNFLNSGMNAVFKLLERPNVQGNVEKPIPQITLNEAIALLRDLVNDGKMKINVNNKEIQASNMRIATFDADTCVPTKQNIGKPLPSLPNQFQTIIETNIVNLLSENYTEEVREFYDFYTNRALIIKYTDYKTRKEYFLYDTMELIVIEDTACTVTSLNGSFIEDPFGFFTNFSGAHINTPSYYLNYGFNLTTEYLGYDEVRGIQVEKWTSCVYVDKMSSFIKLTWAFADNFTWVSQVDPSMKQYPVEIVYEGFKDNSTKYETFRNHYVSFRPYIEPEFFSEIFETPTGVYCPGRKQTKPLPNVTNEFSYKYEAAIDFEHLVTVQSEYFDSINKISRIDYQPFTLDAIIALGTNTITEIHDFNAGIRYIIDKKSEKCLNITLLDGSMSDAIIEKLPNGTNYVRIRNALEMYQIDKGQYEYHGSKKIRNIDCDVWIARKENYPQPGYTSTFEWYFSQDYWTSFNSGKLLNQVPIKLIVTTYTPNAAVFGTVVYNYFDYRDEKPDIFSFNLQNCFDGLDSRHLMFTYKGVDFNSIPDKHALKTQIIAKITSLTYILPTRMSGLELDFVDGGMNVLLKLLEKPPIRGNVQNPVQQISLSDAATILEKYINNGKLSININSKEMLPLKGSLVDVSRAYKSPFADSWVIGTIVGTAILGMIVGVGLLILFERIKEAKAELPSLSMRGLMTDN